MSYVYRYDTTKTRPVYPLDALAACAMREVMIRRRAYPNRVDTGRMRAARANDEIAMMQQIAQLLGKLADEERERLL